MPSRRGQTQSTDGVVSACETLEIPGGWDRPAFGATVPGTPDKLIYAPSSIQEMMALPTPEVTPAHTSVPTALPCVAGHHEQACWLLLTSHPFHNSLLLGRLLMAVGSQWGEPWGGGCSPHLLLQVSGRQYWAPLCGVIIPLPSCPALGFGVFDAEAGPESGCPDHFEYA